jgi:hypothetical protein
MTQKTTPNFKKMLRGASQGEVVIPLLRAYLADPQFKSFVIKVRGFEQRPADGWFHPSAHPTWPERMLYYYLTQPESMIPEPLDPESVMAITQGIFWHEFTEVCLMDAGYLIAREVYHEDQDVGSRGSLDGVGVPQRFGIDEEVFEFKTMKNVKIGMIDPGAPLDQKVIDSFRALEPGYYLQAQEYMRLSGHRWWRGLIHGLEYPFKRREIAFPFDPQVAYATRDKYMRVRQAVADQRLPQACCAPKSTQSKECPFRAVCPVGQGRAA